jgi:hypothetical protein
VKEKAIVTDPLALSYGMGVDSTAVLVGWWRLGIRPHWIGHAQVGNEWPETYAYRPVIDKWLAEVGFPTITDVQYVVQRPKNGFYATLEENCLVNQTLPSLAFGYKKCSLKWKGEPLDAACADYFAAHIKAGGKVQRAIGYDAGPCDSKRGGVETQGPWSWIYPLRQWGWDRARCEKEIAEAGLPVPPKSACFFCPSTKPAELIQLARKHPDLARRAVVMEDRARPGLTKIEGLWGTGTKGTKGTRGGEKKPGSWRAFFAEHAPEVLPELPDPVETKGAA